VATKALRYTKEGLLIPAAWLKRLGGKVAVRRSASRVIIESAERDAARRRLARMVRALRRAPAGRGALAESEFAAEVDAVKRRRARRR
jgi:hypothetical protein